MIITKSLFLAPKSDLYLQQTNRSDVVLRNRSTRRMGWISWVYMIIRYNNLLFSSDHPISDTFQSRQLVCICLDIISCQVIVQYCWPSLMEFWGQKSVMSGGFIQTPNATWNKSPKGFLVFRLESFYSHIRSFFYVRYVIGDNNQSATDRRELAWHATWVSGIEATKSAMPLI